MNTRWRPTPYRDLHVGHIPSAYDCWLVARQSGGKFVMIVDDFCYAMQRIWVQSWAVHHAAERFAEDLHWVGCGPDEVVFSTTNAAAHADAAERLGLTAPGRSGGGWTPDSLCQPLPAIQGVRNVWAGAQYHPYYTMLKVVDDHECGISCFTRGADLLYEAEAYDTMWRRLYPAGQPPIQRYVPTVCIDKEKMSKSGRNAITIRDLRDAGYTGRQVLDTLLQLLEADDAPRVNVPPDVLTTDKVSALPRPLPKDLQANREEATKWCAAGQWGMDVIRAIGAATREA